MGTPDGHVDFKSLLSGYVDSGSAVIDEVEGRRVGPDKVQLQAVMHLKTAQPRGDAFS
jgi:hypothetical protein